jgi:hypothetical protein
MHASTCMVMCEVDVLEFCCRVDRQNAAFWINRCPRQTRQTVIAQLKFLSAQVLPYEDDNVEMVMIVLLSGLVVCQLPKVNDLDGFGRAC